jgi:hypothetical protein
MRRFASTIALAAIAIDLTASAAGAATANRTWVSHTGISGNTGASPPCNPQMPCDTFANALSVTSAGGEINCVDNGSYGAVTITQSVTIDCGGQLGTIDVSGSTNAITINDANVMVKLRNLTVNGNGGSGFGVLVSNAAAVTIEACVLQDFNSINGAGILAEPASSLQLNVTDSLIANNSASGNGGIVILPTGSANVNFVLDRIRVESNPVAGIWVQGNLSSGVIKGFIRDTVVTGSTGLGGIVVTHANTTVSVYRTHAVGNSTGISSGGGAAVILSNSTIQANDTALSSSGSAAIFSYGNNDINNNQPGGLGSAPTVIGQH